MFVKRINTYNLINAFVFGITFLWFIYDFHDAKKVLGERSLLSWMVLLCSVVLVHVLKAFRLYFALYGTGIELEVYIYTYCMVTPVSILLPFKVGEVFRMYCYGKQIDNVLKGVIIVFLDRFMDTSALVSMILLVWIFDGGSFSFFIYILVIFLVLSGFLYFVFPGMFQFWKKYLLRAKASEHKLWGLKTIEKFWILYQEAENVIKGRGIILYFLSFAAWLIEMGSVAIINRIEISSNVNTVISGYLISAIGGKELLELRQFVFVSVIILALFFIFFKMSRLYVRKEGIL